MFGGALGIAVGFPLGVYGVGCAGDQTGSLGWTYVGALAGASVAGLAGIAVPHDGSRGTGFNTLNALLIGVITAPMGAIIGFNLSRAYERAPSVAIVPIVTRDTATVALGGRF